MRFLAPVIAIKICRICFCFALNVYLRHNAAITACERASGWVMALGLLERLRKPQRREREMRGEMGVILFRWKPHQEKKHVPVCCIFFFSTRNSSYFPSSQHDEFWWLWGLQPSATTVPWVLCSRRHSEYQSDPISEWAHVVLTALIDSIDQHRLVMSTRQGSQWRPGLQRLDLLLQAAFKRTTNSWTNLQEIKNA